MPQTFLWMTSEDDLVDVNEGLDLVKALISAGGPYEFHVFQKGPHGMALGNQSGEYGESAREKFVSPHKWFQLALQWLKGLD